MNPVSALRLTCLIAFFCIQSEAQAEEKLAGRAVASAELGVLWDRQWRAVDSYLAADDAVELSYFTRGERGSEAQLLHDLRRGRAHMGSLSLQGLAGSVPELWIALAPNLFDSLAEATFVYDEYLFDIFSELFAQKGLRLLRWTELREQAADLPSSDHSYVPDAVVVNATWYDEATEPQQNQLRGAWPVSRIAPSELNRRSSDFEHQNWQEEPAPAASQLVAHASQLVAHASQLVAQIGGRSEAVYAAIVRGKRAYGVRSQP